MRNSYSHMSFAKISKKKQRLREIELELTATDFLREHGFDRFGKKLMRKVTKHHSA